MKKNHSQNSSLSSLLTWTALFILAFLLSLPAGSRLCRASTNTYRVSVASGYLALRSAKAYDSSNEIGQLYTGDVVEVMDNSDTSYWYVYAPTLEAYGYVNQDYLAYAAGSSSTWTVAVSKGYLALRTAKAYDASNEIGALYSGDTVNVMDASDATYWYVYSPTLGEYGYVNCNYLYGGSVDVWTVDVSTGYLALRSAKAYDSSNEIGQLFSGDTVQPIDTSDATYWYVYSPQYQMYGYVNCQYLYNNGTSGTANMRTVSVSTGYLALRSAKAYDSSNEIGQLYTGDTVQLIDTSDASYWYVYAPKYALYGYVNKDYLIASGYTEKTVHVSIGYLALRASKDFSVDNEIGQLFPGDTVEVIDGSDSSFAYVYAPSLDKYGYVNQEYIY